VIHIERAKPSSLSRKIWVRMRIACDHCGRTGLAAGADTMDALALLDRFLSMVDVESPRMGWCVVKYELRRLDFCTESCSHLWHIVGTAPWDVDSSQ
jgi:hypothetical protein